MLDRTSSIACLVAHIYAIQPKNIFSEQIGVTASYVISDASKAVQRRLPNIGNGRLRKKSDSLKKAMSLARRYAKRKKGEGKESHKAIAYQAGFYGHIKFKKICFDNDANLSLLTPNTYRGKGSPE